MKDKKVLMMYNMVKLLIIILLLMSVACAIYIGATPPPPPPCPIESLMLEESMFHKDIHQTSPPSKRGAPMRFGDDKLGVGFTSMTQGGATLDVYQARSVKQAQEKFNEQVVYEFSSREGYTGWYTDTFNYQSSVADQFQFSCRKHKASSVENCRFFGQYNIYLIIFDADISSILTYKDMEGLLQTIDNKVVQCLAD